MQTLLICKKEESQPHARSTLEFRKKGKQVAVNKHGCRKKYVKVNKRRKLKNL